MPKTPGRTVGRRTFLQSAAATAALVVKPPIANAQPAPPRSSVPAPSAAQIAAETAPPPARTAAYTVERPGSDFMVDVIKSLGFEYVAANPGSSFRGLHESIINYGGNKSPELLTCCHEESSVAMAHGYAKIDGKPMLGMAHGTVGLQHASMAIYNAWADRVPVYILLGNILDVAYRRSVVEWTHSVQDAVAMVRDYTKWDDAPVSLTHFAASAVRAYKTAMTPAMGPVVIVADAVLQEEPIPEADRHALRVPKLTLAAPPAGDPSAIAEAARLLVAAHNPGIVARRRRPPGDRRRPRRAHGRGTPPPGRTGRNAAGAGERSAVPVPHELSDPASVVRRRQHRRCRRRARTGGAGFLECHARADAGQPHRHGGARDDEARRETRHHLVERSADQEQLPGLRRVRRSRSRDLRRCGSKPAVAD